MFNAIKAFLSSIGSSLLESESNNKGKVTTLHEIINHLPSAFFFPKADEGTLETLEVAFDGACDGALEDFATDCEQDGFFDLSD